MHCTAQCALRCALRCALCCALAYTNTQNSNKPVQRRQPSFNGPVIWHNPNKIASLNFPL